MTENEMYDKLYERHGKPLINLTEACRTKEFGMSYSKASKLFGGENALAESIIIEKGLLPKWKKKDNGQRMWELSEIARWQIEKQ